MQNSQCIYNCFLYIQVFLILITQASSILLYPSGLYLGGAPYLGRWFTLYCYIAVTWRVFGEYAHQQAPTGSVQKPSPQMIGLQSQKKNPNSGGTHRTQMCHWNDVEILDIVTILPAYFQWLWRYMLYTPPPRISPQNWTAFCFDDRCAVLVFFLFLASFWLLSNTPTTIVRNSQCIYSDAPPLPNVPFAFNTEP